MIIKIDNGKLKFSIVLDASAFPGVKRITGYVSADFEKVFGTAADVTECDGNGDIDIDGKIVVATLGHDALADTLINKGLVEASLVQGKREVYQLKICDNSILIVGSDKRGTIYGLFKLSEMIGVSPLTNWNHVMPAKKECVELLDSDSIISKEPSVKYRGFFINDEWPAFGNWSDKNFGGINAKCYEQVFELLLRLKGNYLWPAMWSAIFSNDGPGLANAELADEMGVVMGMSHHEPCLRNGEEYSHVRGKDSIYGDAWNFRTNEAGITKFWEDGLKRNGRFENVITVGMRGEADSTIMGKDATLKDNIDLLRDVLKTQNKLIREQVNPNLDEVPRMLALYKEVEPFYYGDENTEGLMNCEELEGVTLMLCDDNFGNLRTVPTKQMREHNGGFGMYYHFDYHGWPISFEWVNSSYIPKVCEQMSEAYDFGIRELWIVNVGDIFSMEYPLSYFLDLAYDIDKWGNKDILKNSSAYTTQWVDKQFSTMSKEQKEETERLLKAYTKIASARRPEAMNEKVFGFKRGEAFNHGKLCEKLMADCEKLYASLDESIKNVFFQFVYYPLMGNLNVHKLWTDTAMNHYLSDIGATAANTYVNRVNDAIAFDKELVNRLHTEDNGRWYGMGMSEHIGFRNWNEEECAYPLLRNVIPANKPRIIAVNPMNGEHTEGGDWTKKTLVLEASSFDKNKAEILLCAASDKDAEFEITKMSEGIELELIGTCLTDNKGIVRGGELIPVFISTEKVNCDEKPYMVIHTQTGGNIRIELDLTDTVGFIYGEKVIEAKDYVYSEPAKDGSKFTLLEEYGKYEDAVKVVPVINTYAPGEGPTVTYKTSVPKAGKYELEIHMTPTNPAYMDGKLLYAISINDGDLTVKNAVKENFKVGDDQPFWMNGVLENIRITKMEVELNEGENSFSLSAMSPCFVLQRLVLKTVE